LLLDLENPRITKANSQREALQRIIEDQDLRLAVLAESIVEQGGLNPMDRWLVLPAAGSKTKYTVFEGNRRLSALRLLHNPALLASLEIRSPVKKRLAAAAKEFDAKSVNPIDCFVLKNRQEGALWLNQRHTGANKGSGIVDWNGLATARFRGSDPALQALDAVLKFGGLAQEDVSALEAHFPITTLDRLLSTPEVRAVVGLDIKKSKLLTDLPPKEAIRGLRRMVVDLGNGEMNVTKLKLKDQQVAYVKGFGEDLPALKLRTGTWLPVEEWDEDTFAVPPETKGKAPTPKPVIKKKKPAERRVLITRDCQLTVKNPKLQEIEQELRTLRLSEHKHAIAVLFRVFLETSVDYFLTQAGKSLFVTDKGGHKKDKSLQAKVTETITEMIAAGIPSKYLDGVAKGIHDKKNPLSIDTLHAYVHNQFYSPKESDLTTAFDNARPFFEEIWK
jgi:hypothetical protein